MAKVIVAGSRSITNPNPVYRAIRLAMECGLEFDEVVTGGAKGPDTIAHEAAKQKGVPTKVFEPDWDKHGYAAGPRRNTQMASYADALVAIWDGQSNGTKDMIYKARRTGGMEVFVSLHKPDTGV